MVFKKGHRINLGRKITEETTRKMSEIHKANPNSGQFKKGYTSWNKGKHLSKHRRNHLVIKHPSEDGIVRILESISHL